METLQGSDRRQQHRKVQFVPEKCSRGVDLPHVVQDTGSKRDLVEGGPIPLYGRLAFGAAAQIVPDIAVQIAAGEFDDLV